MPQCLQIIEPFDAHAGRAEADSQRGEVGVGDPPMRRDMCQQRIGLRAALVYQPR